MAACRRIKSMGKDEFRAFFNSFDVVLSDCDGVLWREMEVVHRSPETVEKLKEMGKKFYYITNNDCKTRADLINKCKSLTYDATEEDMLCSSYLAAIYLKQKNFAQKAYVVGGPAIVKELEAQGIKSVGVGPDVMEGDEVDTLLRFKPDPEVGAVIVGFDKHFSYPKLMKAATYLHEPHVLFIGTHPDVERPSPNRNRFPGPGCLLRAIEAVAGRQATILGKPGPFVGELIKKKYNVDPARTLMIGDNLNTDILLGKRFGYTTLLVMSGVTTDADLQRLQKDPKNSIVPNFYADRLSDVLDCLKAYS
ncbi:glycerol-3-phosphate phosphatase-like isoform X1 [Copidosoma floridanum]|uniref:glycerol-3-phosphate phosphatase-like isoform X1 n=1 Tax=Copidosoma floridanum TaxID=29053 RepID=UPI0006C9E5CF|nr:glycerol-3-phosphate phosphatase-like isoform X1 [Copidosoma floridanum]XP_014208929.1 glycerol-3-phosphate phosphatase-like isoform X1 [Copidosoma floridanum]